MGSRVFRLMGIGLFLFGVGMPGVVAAEPEDAAATAPPAMPDAASASAPVQAVAAEPTIEQIQDAVQLYVQETTQDEGVFYVDDEVTGETRELTLERVHDTFGTAGDYYYVCTEMKDDKSGELLDVDFDVESYEGELEVVDIRIHKVGGTERYAYNEHGNRQ